MALSRFLLPNIRKLFIPDPGKLIFDVDLTGADAAVAAKECGGEYWEAIKSGRKINLEILEFCYPETYAKWKAAPPELKDVVREPGYTKGKNMHYGSIYVGSPKGISSSAAIPIGIVSRMQPWFFDRFPSIKGWHQRKQEELYATRGVRNAFGYRVVYFDRLEKLLPEAVNWVCQSTVAIVCQRGSLLIRRDFSDVDLLLQVHDSLVCQVDLAKAARILPELRARLNHIPIPYEPEPLYIPWGMKASETSWGDCQDINWEYLERKAT